MGEPEVKTITEAINVYTDASLIPLDEKRVMIGGRKVIEYSKVSVAIAAVQLSDHNHYVDAYRLTSHDGDGNIRETDYKDDRIEFPLTELFTSWSSEFFGIYYSLVKIRDYRKLSTYRYVNYTICCDCKPSLFLAQYVALDCQKRYNEKEKKDIEESYANKYILVFNAYKDELNRASSNGEHEFRYNTFDDLFIGLIAAFEKLAFALLGESDTHEIFGCNISFAWVPAHFENKTKRSSIVIQEKDSVINNLLMKCTYLDLFYQMFVDDHADTSDKIPDDIKALFNRKVRDHGYAGYGEHCTITYDDPSLDAIQKAVFNLDSEWKTKRLTGRKKYAYDYGTNLHVFDINDVILHVANDFGDIYDVKSDELTDFNDVVRIVTANPLPSRSFSRCMKFSNGGAIKKQKIKNVPRIIKRDLLLKCRANPAIKENFEFDKSLDEMLDEQNPDGEVIQQLPLPFQLSDQTDSNTVDNDVAIYDLMQVSFMKVNPPVTLLNRRPYPERAQLIEIPKAEDDHRRHHGYHRHHSHHRHHRHHSHHSRH